MFHGEWMDGSSHSYFEFDEFGSPSRIKDMESETSNITTVFWIEDIHFFDR